MSLPDSLRHPFLVIAMIALAGLGSACTVRPLYADIEPGTGAGAPQPAALQSISIEPVQTRYAQEVRNKLIFLLNGGTGQPAQAKYKMKLVVSRLVLDEAAVGIDNETRPSAGTLHMTGDYALTDAATGKVVATGSRTIPASYDKTGQEFANARAVRDAENRAAAELAELLRLDIGQKLAKIKA